MSIDTEIAHANSLLKKALDFANKQELKKIYLSFKEKINEDENNKKKLDKLDKELISLRNDAILSFSVCLLSSFSAICYSAIKPLTYLTQTRSITSNAHIPTPELIHEPTIGDLLTLGFSCSLTYLCAKRLDWIHTEILKINNRFNKLVSHIEQQKRLILDLQKINAQIDKKLSSIDTTFLASTNFVKDKKEQRIVNNIQFTH